jgi:glycosyltransferase involved in cell wall biosynthesis
VLVVTSPVAATTEAITDRVSGLVADTADTEAWVRALRQLGKDDAMANRLRTEARRWVEDNFDAHRNAARLREKFRNALAIGPGVGL